MIGGVPSRHETVPLPHRHGGYRQLRWYIAVLFFAVGVLAGVLAMLVFVGCSPCDPNGCPI